MFDRKIITFIGCAMVHLITGTIYCTGSIMPYIASYIGSQTGYVSNESLSIVFYICIFSYACAFQPSAWLHARFSPKKPIYLGAILYITVVFIAAGLTTRIPIIVVYGVILGIASGFSYAPALMIAINCYPHRKGLVTGIIIGCFAFGSFFFNFIALGIVNPSNKLPTIVVVFNGKKEKFFDIDVAGKVPQMFLILAGIYTAILIPALFMIKDIEKEPEHKHEPISQVSPSEDVHLQVKVDNHDESSRVHSELSSNHPGEEEKHDLSIVALEKQAKDEGANPGVHLTIKQCFQTRQLYQIFFATMFSGTAGMFAVASFKTIGLSYGYTDSFLTIVGSLGSAINGSNRPFWGYLFDRKSYRFAYMVILCIQIAICFTFPAVNQYQVTFLIWLVVLYSCSGGTFTQLAPIAVRLYGKEVGVRVYPVFIFAMGCSALAVYFIQTYVTLYVDASTFFYILGGLSVCALASNCLFSEKFSMKVR